SSTTPSCATSCCSSSPRSSRRRTSRPCRGRSAGARRSPSAPRSRSSSSASSSWSRDNRGRLNAPLLERLAAGRGAAPAVVTPNSRLAQGLARELDAFQAARGVALWEAPDILPFPAFVERLYEEALYSDAGGGLPALLTAAQEEHLWREILRGSKRELLVVEQAAAQCREAWQLVHAWRIPPGAGNEDAAAFSEWAAAYRRRTAREVDAARLPDAVATWLLGLRLPRALVAYGFDILAPQTREFFDA